jgi:hypothetical protein
MAWSIVGVGSVVEVTVTTHTLTEPAGCAAGDLLVACIGSRIAHTTSITLPSGWTRVTEQKINNVVLGTTGQPSACMAYIKRGASAPALGFTHPTAPNVARGQIVAYRENTAGNGISFDAFGGGQTATAITAISIASSVTTTAASDLLVGMVAGGSASTYTAFKTANAPSTASGATNTSSAPSTTTWTERADASSATGADIGLSIFDAVKTATGAGGAITATASVSSGHAVLMGAFRTLPIIANAWDSSDRTYTVTLSNSDKTATHTPAATGGIRSSTERTNGAAGKYYAEWVATTIGASSQFCLKSKTSDIGAPGTESFRYLNGGQVFVGGTQVATMGVAAAGDIVCVAWDSGAERFWFRLNGGLWNNDASADPATGTNGLDASALPNTSFCLYWAGITAAVTTLRTELAEYTQAIPSGFKSWMGETPVGGTGVTVSVTGQATTAAVGEVTISIPAPVNITVDAAGQAVTSTVGNPSVTGKSSFIATGQAVTSAVGPLALIVTHARFTVAAPEILASTQGVGVEAGGSISTTASGSEITSGVGQVSVKADHRFSVTGQQVASSVGEVSVTGKANVSTLVAGQATTAGVGQVTIDARSSVSTTATGQEVAASVGQVSVSTVVRIDVTVNVVAPMGGGRPDESLVAFLGTPTITGKANVSTIPTGQAISTAVGTPTITANIGVSMLLAGQELVSAVGVPSITTHARFSVSGQSVTSAVGQVSVTSGTGVTIVVGGSASPTLPAYRSHTFSSYIYRPFGLTLDKPAGTVENDVMLAAIVHVKSPTALNDIVAPAGWTKIGTSTVVAASGASAKLEVWWKRAGGSEPASYFFDVWADSDNQYSIISYSGCPTSGSPIDAFSTNSANTGATATGLSLTTTQANDALIWIGHNWDASTTLTPPAGMTERADSLLYISEQDITAAGATGNRTQTLASSNPWAVYLLSLKGAPGAAAFPGLSASVSPPAAITGTGNVLLAGQEVTASGRGVGVTAGGSVSTTVSSGLATTAAGQVGVKADHRFSVTAPMGGGRPDESLVAFVGQVTVDARQTVSTTVVGQSLAVSLSPVTVTAGVRTSVSLAGQSVASAVGAVNFSLAISALVPVSSEEMSAEVGAIFFPTGLDDSVTLDGQTVQAEVGAVTVTTVALRGMDVWTGTAWAGKPAKVWTGSAWVPKPVKLWNGSSWV